MSIFTDGMLSTFSITEIPSWMSFKETVTCCAEKLSIAFSLKISIKELSIFSLIDQGYEYVYCCIDRYLGGVYKRKNY
jgi:hypothetical protein